MPPSTEEPTEEQIAAQAAQAAQARNQRTSLYWAYAHDVAGARYPADECPRFFTDEAGERLLNAIHEAAADPAADLDAVIDRFIPDPKAPQPAPAPEPQG